MNYFIIFNSILLIILLPLLNCEDLECVPYLKKNKSTSFFRRLFQKPKNNINYHQETKFYLLTRKTPKCTQELKLNDINTLNKSNFNSSWPVRILIHGWKNNLYSPFNELLKDAYLKNNDFNVIIVDWSDIANDPNYARSSSATREIGKIVAEFTIFLHNTTNIKFDSIYLIGHSLGAQISGIAGYLIQPKYKFNTIFALDPAEPNFDKSIDLKYKIDSSDADYVESIQTDLNLFGQQEPVGHAAFFPAYGKIQPGCHQIISGCSHSRAYKYLAESLNTKVGFWSVRCKNMNEINQQKCSFNGYFAKMGGEPSNKKIGVYYVPIRSMEPFAIGLIM